MTPNSSQPTPVAARTENGILVRIVEMLLIRAEKAGLDRQSLKRAAGLSPSDLADPDARVPVSRMVDLWREIIRCIDDPLMGLKLGRSIHTREIGLVGYIMAASRSLDLALRSLSRYSRIISDDMEFTIQVRGALTDLEVTASVDLIALVHPISSRIAGTLGMMRHITETRLQPVEVRLPQPLPPDPAPYREFFQCPVHFDSGAATLTIRTQDLDLPIPSADLALSHYLENYARSVLDAFPPEDSLVSHIWRILMVRLPAGDPGIDGIASTLGLNARTVQRRLKDEGTTYRDLRDSFRHTTARKLLANPRVPIKEIAFLLGYQDLGAFYRAFRRWEDVAPLDYRKKHIAA